MKGISLNLPVSKIIFISLILFCSPSTYSWHGGAAISQSARFPEMLVTKKEWEEDGYYICDTKFDI